MSLRKQLLGISAATAIIAASAVPTQAFTPELVDAKLHYLKCLVLVFTDPETHIVECGVSEMGTPQSLSFHITGVIIPDCGMYMVWEAGKCQYIPI